MAMATSLGGEPLDLMSRAYSRSNPSFARRAIRLARGTIALRSSIRMNNHGAAGEGGEGMDIPVLSCSEVIERMRENQAAETGQYLAMYSSITGGITTDPAAMVIPLDDHMVHRGHGVFDTAAIVNGYLYEVDQHLDRILRSASTAKITPPFGREAMKNILIQTVTVSKCQTGSLRYWLSAGPGDFNLSPSGCPRTALYAVVIKQYNDNSQKRRGVRVVTSSIPIKPPVCNHQERQLSSQRPLEDGGQEKDTFAAIWLDDEGFIAEGPNMNVGFVTEEREFIMPKFDKILSGCTARRSLVLAKELVRKGLLAGIQVRDIRVEEGKKALEMMLIGSGVLIKPVLQWDEDVIGDGKEGPVALALLDLILEDMRSGPPEVRTPVPYT